MIKKGTKILLTLGSIGFAVAQYGTVRELGMEPSKAIFQAAMVGIGWYSMIMLALVTDELKTRKTK